MRNNIYAAYVKAIGNNDGSAMGGAYIITDRTEVWKSSKISKIGTRAYEMELRAILGVVSSLPDGAMVNIYTNNKLLESVNCLKSALADAKFYDLKKSFLNEKKRLKGVNVVYKRKSCNNVYLNSANEMAKDEFLNLCHEKGITNRITA